MKKILLTLFVAASLLSCSKDDDGGSSSSETNQADFGDSVITFQTTSAITEDYGQDDSHYNREFYIDGTLDGKEVELFIDLYSLGETFSTGAFQVNENETTSYFYSYLDIYTPGVGDAEGSWEYYYENSGTVTVSKIDGDIYTLVVNITFVKEGTDIETDFTGTIEMTFTED